jgi:minor extracellular serine protease Vpr
MKRSGFGVVLAATAVTILAGAPPDASLAAGSVSRLSGSVPASANEFSGLWFVELSGLPSADGGNKAQLKNEKAAFRAAARDAGVSLRERYAFDTLWNGVSISASDAEIGKLRRLPGVKAVYPVEIVAAPEPKGGVSPDLFTSRRTRWVTPARASRWR